MSLDKQKILNELGSVVNQLQSADCGCMSRLFNDGTNPNQYGDGHAYHGSHCGWGHNPCAGEPHMASCVAHCNPPKLIADTYNYYDQNVVKPAMEEVYNELKSITPENTVVNHPLAAQMGVVPKGMPNMGDPLNQGGGKPNQGHTMGQGRQIMGGMDHQSHVMGGMHGPGQVVMNGLQADPLDGMGEQMQGMGGLMPGQHQGMPAVSGNHPGPAIGGMTSGQGQLMSGMPGTNQGQPVNGMMAGPGQVMGEMMPGQIQATGGRFGQNLGAAQGNMMSGQSGRGMTGQMQGQPIPPMMGGQGPGMGGMSVQNPSQSMNGIPGTQGQHMGGMVGTQGQTMSGQNHGISGMNTQQFSQMNSQPMPHPLGNQRGVGQHSAALKKFNEVFPGVMSGDLGFNPMEMAIKMNPDNKQPAFNTMNSPMMVNNMQPVTQTPVPANINQQQVPQMMNQQHMPQMMNQHHMPQMMNQQNMIQQQVPNNVNQQHIPQMMNQQHINQLQVPNNIHQQHMAPAMNQQQIPNQHQMQEVISQQQMPLTMGQQKIPQNQINQQLQQQMPSSINQQDLIQYQQLNHPQMVPTINQQQMPTTMGHQPTNSVVPSTTGANYANAQPSENITVQQMQQSPIMDPIMPVVPETGFNTLGQPVEMVPGNLYGRHDTGPPQPIIGGGYGYSNVKNTISKTSIMGHHLKGSYKTPSRSQLQHLYNQYKGSQSYTQQNIQDPKYAGTASDGRLDVMRRNPKQHIPLERVGGDTEMNNQINQQVKGDNEANNLQPNKLEYAMGDEPTKLPKPENPEIKKAEIQEPGSLQPKRCRNGLQDMVYTSYSLGASWTFHGSIPPRIYRRSLQ